MTGEMVEIIYGVPVKFRVDAHWVFLERMPEMRFRAVEDKGVRQAIQASAGKNTCSECGERTVEVWVPFLEIVIPVGGGEKEYRDHFSRLERVAEMLTEHWGDKRP